MIGFGRGPGGKAMAFLRVKTILTTYKPIKARKVLINIEVDMVDRISPGKKNPKGIKVVTRVIVIEWRTAPLI